MNIHELAQSLGQLAMWVKWEGETLNEFHSYAKRFGAPSGCNVFQFVLEQALTARGVTLDQFRAEMKAGEMTSSRLAS
ncbi:MAG: hypothetical protein ACJ74Z_03400 [Bryobacteraceae bacterium]